MDREILLEPIVQSVRKGTAYSRYEIARAYADWTLIPIMVDDAHVGTLTHRGTEVHIALVDGWRPRGSYRGLIRDLLRPLFERHGFLTTRLQFTHITEKAFIERVGFKPTWNDDQFQYYLLASMPFEKRKP